LLATGRVSWLGEPLAKSTAPAVGHEMTRTLNRVRDLLRAPAAAVSDSGRGAVLSARLAELAPAAG
jgi:hypothetical protein